MRIVACQIAIAGLLMSTASTGALAQSSSDAWNLFKWLEPAPPPSQPPPDVDRANPERASPPVRGRPVESSDLAPVMAADTSGLPLSLWRGLDMAELEGLLARIDLPPRSPALHQLWRRMLLSTASPPTGAGTPDQFAALRLAALYRSGLLADMAEVVQGNGPPSGLIQVLAARKDIGLGARDAGCAALKSLGSPGASLRGRLRSEAQLLTGYCAAAAGDAAAAGLAANLAREEGATDELALRVLDSVSLGTKAHPALPARMSLLDYRFLELIGDVKESDLLAKAEPALLVALADGPTSDVRLRTAAAEAALRLNAMSSEAVARVYRLQPEPSGRLTASEAGDPLLRRARLFRAAEATQTPELKARLLRTLLDEAQRSGIHVQTARMLVPLVAQLWPTSETGSLAETVVEIALAGGEYELARRWAETSINLQHWAALIELVDPQGSGNRRPALGHLEDLASKGRLSGELLRRLAAVLDALEVDLPVGLWEAVVRTPQPTSGYLPETGVLAELAQSAQRQDSGRTILAAMQAIGPNGAEGANILALGDTVRALKRTGLERDARLLAFEALFALWPRTPAN